MIWYVPYLEFIRQNQDVIRAVVYINADWDSQPMWIAPYASGYWGDSRVQAAPVILEKWRQVVQQDFWLQAGPQLFQLLGYSVSLR